MQVLDFLIIIIYLSLKIKSKRVCCFINLNSSYIIVKIKGPGNKNIFHPEGSFLDSNYPDIVKINTQSINPIRSIQYLSQEINTVILEWTNDREDYSHIFHGCTDILEIDLTNFKTSQVKLMGSMFRECSSLTSINFANFDSTNAENMGAMFFGCKKLTSIDLSRFDTSHVTYMWNMFAECSSLTSLDLSKFKTSELRYMWGMFSDCMSLTSLDLSNFDISLVNEMGDLFKNCINLEYINLLNFKENSLNYAGNMFQSVPNNVVICLGKNNSINKIITELKTRQCYSIDCSDNWKSKQNKIINDTGECIINCIDSDQYKYEYDNKCFNECPIGSKDEGNYTCKCLNDKCLECPDEAYTKNLCTKCNYDYFPKENDSLNIGKYIECYKNPNGFYLDSVYSIYRKCYYTCETCEKEGNELNHNCLVCKENQVCLSNDDIKYNLIDILKEINNVSKNEELNEYYDKIIEIVQTYFSIRIYNTSNIDNGEEDIILVDNMHVTLTNSENQKNNINNDSYITNNTLIDLTQCEKSLRVYYNISNDESLYILKIDVIQKGMKIPKVEYDVFSKLEGKNLQKLNLSICENDKINIFTSVDSISNLDIINPISKYYTDICYPATSDFGTDITLNDRKNEFVEKNKTVCQEDCIFIGYNYTSKKANCSCDVKEPSLTYKNMIIDKNKLFHNFLDINNIANIDFLFCYEILFRKNELLKNIGSYILILIILFHIIFIFIFYIKSYLKIINIINNFFNYKNNNLSESKGSRKNILGELNNQNLLKQKNNEKIIFNKNNLSVYKELKKKKKNHSKIKINKIKDVKIIKKQINLSNIFKYTIDEINSLPYELAIKNDKRTYCDYYISLLKTKHDLLFSFCYNQDYNSKILKIDLFFLGFTTSYIINGLFFTEDTLHKIYIDKSSFDFIYQLPKTIYSTIISSILDFILESLALSNDAILDFKNIKSNKDLSKGRNYLLIKLKIKFVLYFIISSILLILFWYYIAMFGVIYKNTQIHLIKDTICSFIETLVYPFWINLLPGIFRIPALSNKKYKRVYIYKISQVLQKI